ncbi:MAG: hypothetical protein P1V97_05595 [Planctomycetota bacterium]|nr:hypothetical protein [Planctomycetota bacterium]
MVAMEFVPALKAQRALYDIPRGRKRFERYLEVMLNDNRTDVKLPLPAFNPMGGDSVKEALDRLLALEADAVAERALIKLQEDSKSREWCRGPSRISLVLVDDEGGQWTHREIFESQIAGFHPSAKLSQFNGAWVPIYLWAGDSYEQRHVEEAVRGTIFRAGWIRGKGLPRTLRDVLIQEAMTANFAGKSPIKVGQAELEDILSVIQRFLASEHFPTIFSCCYGDRIADSAGYAMLNLAERAGLRIPLKWLELETPNEKALFSSHSNESSL